MPGQLPDLLDVSDLLLGAVVDPERVLRGIGAPAGDRVAEPARLPQVRSGDAEYLQVPGQDRVRGGDNSLPRVFRDLAGGTRRQDGGKAPVRYDGELGGRDLRGTDLPPHPRRTAGVVDRAPQQLLRRHPPQPADIPADRLAAHTCPGRPLARLRSTATVAAVV